MTSPAASYPSSLIKRGRATKAVVKARREALLARSLKTRGHGSCKNRREIRSLARSAASPVHPVVNPVASSSERVSESCDDFLGGRLESERRARLWRRHVSHSTMLFAIRPLANWTAAEVKRGMTGIAARPAAGFWAERADLFGGGPWAGEGGYLGARRCRLDAERSGRPGLGTAVRSGGGTGGSLLELSYRHHPCGEETKQNGDPVRDAARPVLPAPDAAPAGVEQLADAAWRDVKRVECPREFGRGRVNDHDDVI
jgi:hypothetical protein